MVAGAALLLAVAWVLEESPIADWVAAPLLTADSAGAADALVVFGAGLVGPCELNISGLRRAALATTLWAEGRAPIVVFTGGAPPGLDCAVSEVMANHARRLGMPGEAIRIERASRSTFENARGAAAVLETLNARTVVAVTDRLHMPRASAVLRAQGYDVHRSAVPVYATVSGNLRMLFGTLREYAALSYYWWRGWTAALPPMTHTPWPPPTPPAHDGPVVLLGASYAQGWTPQRLGGRPVRNAGVTGQQSFELAERFEREVAEAGAGVVIAWGFINDIFRAPAGGDAAAVDRIRESYARMADKARERGIELVLATEITMTTRHSVKERTLAFVGRLLGKVSYQDRVNRHVREVNDWMRGFARDRGLVLLDFEKVLAGPDGQRRRTFAQADGSHLTAAAYDSLTAYADPALARRWSPVR